MASVWCPLRSLDLHEHLPSTECTLQLVEESITRHVDALTAFDLPPALWCLTALDVTREAVALRLLPAMIQPRLAQMTQKNAQACVDRWISLERGLLKRRLLSDAHVWHVSDLLAQSGAITRAVAQRMPSDDWVSDALCQQVDVPFESCPQLVAERQVVLHQGWARLISSEQMAYVLSRVVATPQDWLSPSQTLPDSRLALIARAHLSKLWNLIAPSSIVCAETLVDHAPCVKRMLETAPHLNFDARRLYGSYAAVAGIPVSTSLSVWQKSWEQRYKGRAASEIKVIKLYWEHQHKSATTKSPACVDMMKADLCPFITSKNQFGRADAVVVCKHVCGIEAELSKFPRVLDISLHMRRSKPHVDITLTP